MGSFRFRQFEIMQDRCAMKVGTDGVLLGAWAEGGRRILDIGTGTALIALMMAQRFPLAGVTGIDIDAEACGEARENVERSPFAGRVDIVHARLQEYGGEMKKYDSIVSNPPFFVNSLKNPGKARSVARHTDTLSFRDLFAGVKRLLVEEGVFSAIVPVEVVDNFVNEGYIHGFRLTRKCGVKTVARKQPKRYLLAFTRRPGVRLIEEEQVMMESPDRKSEWYEILTKDFYLQLP